MQAFLKGRATELHTYQPGSLGSILDLPASIDAESTARYIRTVMDGAQPVPAPIAEQVAHILHLFASL
jgi:hypothetical protein